MIHLSIRNLAKIKAELTPLYGADCPVVVAYRIGWPDERILRGTLSDISEKVAMSGLQRTAMIFVGRGLDPKNFRDSALYHEAHSHAARSKA